MYALNSGTLPINFANAFSENRDVHQYNTRNQLNPHIQSRRTNILILGSYNIGEPTFGATFQMK